MHAGSQVSSCEKIAPGRHASKHQACLPAGCASALRKSFGGGGIAFIPSGSAPGPFPGDQIGFIRGLDPAV